MISLDFIDVIFHFLATSLMGKIIEEDLWLIKNLRVEKQWGARRMMKMFPNKQWKKATLERIIAKIDATGSILRQPGSGRPRSARTANSIALVEQLICSQEGEPGFHHSPREI